MTDSHVTPPSLQATFSKAKGALIVHLRLVNRSDDVALLVFDKLWDLDPSSKLLPDEQHIYRFFDEGKLRLLLGLAPPPATRTVLYRNVPHVTRVPPRGTLEYDLAIPAPVREHNVYFPPPNEAPSVFTAAVTKSAELFVQYLPATPDIKTTPSPLLAGGLNLATPGAWSKALLVRSGSTPFEVAVLRRTDTFERWAPPRPAE